MRNRIFRLTVFIVMAGFVLAAGSVFAQSKDKKTIKGDKNMAQEPAAVIQPQAQAVHPITTAVVNQGGLICASRVNQVSNFLTAGTQNGAIVFFSQPQNPDQGIMGISYEVDRPDGTTAYAGAGFAPGSNGCPAYYETVEYGSAACQDIQSQLFSQLNVAGKLKNNITVLEGGTLKIFLMPAGDRGCVVIKKEMVQ